MVSKLLDRIRGKRTAIDPVCGMEVEIRNPPGGTAKHRNVTYHFCGTGCRLEFEEDAEGYLSGRKKMEM